MSRLLMRPPPPSVSHDAVYPAESSSINGARLDLAAWLGGAHIGVPVDDAVLVLSELVSNAIEASPGGHYRVWTSIEGNRLGIGVTNESTAGVPDPEQWKPKDVLASRGRGLSIVDALTDQVDVTATDGMTTVVAWMRTDDPT